MKERIILSNEFNQAEFLRMLSIKGINTFGLRVLNDKELCDYIIMKNGMNISKKYIDSNEETLIYFLNKIANSYEDSKNIKNAINSYRDCVIGNYDTVYSNMKNNLSDDFKKKKELLLHAYERYDEYKKNNNLADKQDLINYIIKNASRIDIDCIIFDEFKVPPLMNELCEVTFNKIEKSFKEFVGINTVNILKTDNVVKAYGKSNEVDWVFDTINKNNINLCSTDLVLLDDSYSPYVTNYLNYHGIEYTNNFGKNVINTNAGVVLKCIKALLNDEFGLDEYKNLFNCRSFNRSIIYDKHFKDKYSNDKDERKAYIDFIKYVGWLRLSFIEKRSIDYSLYSDDNIREALKEFSEDINKGLSDFVDKYTIDDDYKYGIVEKIKSLDNYKINNEKIDLKQLTDIVLGSTINSKISSFECINITSLDKAFSSLRENIFILGLDSSFPGKPKENYLIYDNEYLSTGSDYYCSNNLVSTKMNKLNKLIEISNNVYCSYSFFTTNDLKNQNPSSIIFKLFDGDVKKINEYEYKDSVIYNNGKAIEEYLLNKKNKITTVSDTVQYDANNVLDLEYSPSQFHSFFDDKVRFILESILKISIDNETDPFNILDSNDMGTCIHKLFENFTKSKISRSDMEKNASKEFDNIMKMKPPIVYSSMIKIKEKFIDLVLNLYDVMDNDAVCIACEERVEGSINGVKFAGNFDRIEKDKNGNYILIDYKTGNKKIHKDNDTESCIQGLIYAYLINNSKEYINKGIEISECKFVYPAFEGNEIVRIPYSESDLLQKIEEFKNAVTNKDFKYDGELKYMDKYLYLNSLIKELKK